MGLEAEFLKIATLKCLSLGGNYLQLSRGLEPLSHNVFFFSLSLFFIPPPFIMFLLPFVHFCRLDRSNCSLPVNFL